MDELSPFMALQKYRYKSIKFIDVFPEAKSLARKIHILYVDERLARLGVKLLLGKEWILFGRNTFFNFRII